MKTIKNFKQFEDVYYPPEPIYETDREIDENLQKFASEFMDEQVGLDLLNVGVYRGGISVNYKKSEREKLRERKPEQEERAKNEWREIAEELIADINKEFGYSGYDITRLNKDGFEIDHEGELPKKITGYSRYTFGG